MSNDWYNTNSGSVDAFRGLIGRQTDAADYPLAASIARNIPIYDGADLRAAARAANQRNRWKTEFIRCLKDGPGALVIKGGIEDPAVLDRTTQLFEQMIDAQHEKGAAVGDHFAKAGSNDRVWNALEKHCLANPENFAQYYACDGIALVSEAWLGTGYQITAQVNRVNPGGSAQSAHRDYHLGFMSADQVATFPAHIHAMSPQLTLQGAVVHRDMPIESGPTMMLPYSQLAAEGYLSFARPEFQAVFADHAVQIPLKKGDLVFFSPALMHAAGANTTDDVWRFGNLLQISSGFGRAMETVNRTGMAVALYPVVHAALRDGLIDQHQAELVIAASAEGYPFPTNLDLDPPIGGTAPKSQAVQMVEALIQGQSPADFEQQMADYNAKRLS